MSYADSENVIKFQTLRTTLVYMLTRTIYKNNNWNVEWLIFTQDWHSVVISLMSSLGVPPSEKLMWWTKSNFWGLLPQSGKTNEIVRSVIIT